MGRYDIALKKEVPESDEEPLYLISSEGIRIMKIYPDYYDLNKTDRLTALANLSNWVEIERLKIAKVDGLAVEYWKKRFEEAHHVDYECHVDFGQGESSSKITTTT
jgi:hypothetical protein